MYTDLTHHKDVICANRLWITYFMEPTFPLLILSSATNWQYDYLPHVVRLLLLSWHRYWNLILIDLLHCGGLIRHEIDTYQSMNIPTTMFVALPGEVSKLPLKRSIRGPSITVATKPATPPTRWTPPEPAISIAPIDNAGCQIKALTQWQIFGWRHFPNA